jgi:hypothetical protein
VSPRKEDLGTPAAVKAGAFSEANFSYYEMTADIHSKLGRLEEAVETLKKSSDKNSEKLAKISEDIVAGKTVLKMFVWIVPVGVALLNILLALALHFWK